MTRLKTTHEGFPNTPEGWDMIINDDFEQLLKAYGESRKEIERLREALVWCATDPVKRGNYTPHELATVIGDHLKQMPRHYRTTLEDARAELGWTDV